MVAAPRGGQRNSQSTGTGRYRSNAITFPVKVMVSKCPDTVQMVSQASTGACNSCHGSTNHIHLP